MSKNKNLVPNLLLILSGKRKSGKDYVFAKLADHFKQFVDSGQFVFQPIVLSSQLKKTYANEHGLDYERLLDSTDYKENYRLDMIKLFLFILFFFFNL